MAQQVKVHADKTEDLSLISRIHMIEKEKTDSHKLSSDFQKHNVSHMHPCKYTEKQIKM